jgi:outer membrane protein TolC
MNFHQGHRMLASIVPLPKGRGLCLYGCFIGLIWFGALNRASAQPSNQSGWSPTIPLTKIPTTLPLQVSTTQNDTPEKIPAPIPALPIGECIKIAHERSPILKAVRASLDSAYASQQGVEKASRFINRLLSPDLKYRKEQAANGVMAAQAELMQAEHDLTFNIVRTYYTAVYAKHQQKIVDELVNQLQIYLKFVKEAVQEGSIRTITKTTEEIFVQNVAKALDRQTAASYGYRRALAALRHEMAVEDGFQFTLAEDSLPNIDAKIEYDVVVAHALSRRGEITLSQMGANVLALEIDAQGAVCFRLKLPTAASGADIHARFVPSGTREGEYRPDGLLPEYPTNMYGDRKSRVAKATALAMRGEAVVEKTRDLVKLEAINNFIKWEEATKRVVDWKIAAEAGKSSIDRVRKDSNNKPTDEKILQLEALVTESRASYNDAVYQQLMALAGIERATAGGIKVNYPGR